MSALFHAAPYLLLELWLLVHCSVHSYLLLELWLLVHCSVHSYRCQKQAATMLLGCCHDIG
jgi:hypothetical protein